MGMRASSLANNPLAVTRELDGKYDVVLEVRDNLDLITQVSGIDFAAILAELEAAQDFTGITVVQGETVAWDAVNKILTIPGGRDGISVHHLKGTSTTQNEGDFAYPGELDTYTFYPDANETYPLGWFNVRNGQDAYNYAVTAGYTGTEVDFYLELANIRSYFEQTEFNTELTQLNADQVALDTVQVAADRVIVVDAKAIVLAAKDVVLAAKDVAVTSADTVQEIFLGSKVSNPIVDNQGNPLVIGVMYFNSTSGTLRIWSGTEWNLGAFSVAGAVVSVNGRDGAVEIVNADITAAVGKDLSDAIKYSEADKLLTDVNKISLSTDTSIAAGIGELTWNGTENTVDIGLNGATLQVGQEQLIRVRNNTGSTIVNGKAIMATGTIGNSGRITIANANLTNTNAKYILGVCTEDVAAGADGFVTAFGKVRGIQTNGGQYGETWVDGDVIYVKDSGNGALTKVVPLDTQVKLPIAIVVNAHATNGTLFIRVNSIDENHAKAELALKANALNAVLTGSPTATTAAVGNATTRIATTAFVVNEINKVEEW